MNPNGAKFPLLELLALPEVGGALLDPRPAYAAADVVVGMGGSALRGMAFGKPVIVVGEAAFASTLTPATASSFLFNGIYGQGDGAGNEVFTAELRTLVEQPALRESLGAFARAFVVEHFSLDRVAAQLAQFCCEAAADVPRIGPTSADAIRTAAIYLRERGFLIPSRDRHTGPAESDRHLLPQ
jgi:hypothetical protein